jgi:hypothetical protein
MLHVSDTAYPRLKAHPTERDLEELFTPNLAELTFAYKYTRRLGPRVALLAPISTERNSATFRDKVSQFLLGRSRDLPIKC